MGSILGYISFPIFFYLAYRYGWITVGGTFVPECLVIICLMAALAIYQHRANVKRLLKGEENKFFSKKK